MLPDKKQGSYQLIYEAQSPMMNKDIKLADSGINNQCQDKLMTAFFPSFPFFF